VKYAAGEPISKQATLTTNIIPQQFVTPLLSTYGWGQKHCIERAPVTSAVTLKADIRLRRSI
jgi:hypothetical protein